LRRDRTRFSQPYAFDDGREVFRLVMAELVLPIRGLIGYVDRIERNRRGDEIDDALERVGIKRGTAGAPIGEILQAHDDSRHGDRNQRGELELGSRLE